MSNDGVQGRDAFRDRVSRIRTGSAHMASPEISLPHGATEPALQAPGETPEDLRERIKATLATEMPVSRDIAKGGGRRMIGLPLVIGTLGLLAIMLMLRHPADEVSAVVGQGANGIFPSFQENSALPSGHAGGKTIKVAPPAER